MPDKKDQTETDAIELDEKELEEASGGLGYTEVEWTYQRSGPGKPGPDTGNPAAIPGRKS